MMICIKAISTKWQKENCIKALLTKMTILKRETNHAWLQNFTWGDLNENDNFTLWKLIIHGYKKMHGGDLNENEKYKQR